MKKVENIVAKGEIARFEQFLLLSLCFQKAVCCKGFRKRRKRQLLIMNHIQTSVADSCKLSCVSQSSNEVVTFDSLVDNGTPCSYDNYNSICIDGKCQVNLCFTIYNFFYSAAIERKHVFISRRALDKGLHDPTTLCFAWSKLIT